MKRRYKVLNTFLAVIGIAIIGLAIAISRTHDCEPSGLASTEGSLMKAVAVRCYGSPDVMEFVDAAKPVAKHDEVIVQVKAASVNPLDWHYMRGSPYLMRLSSGLGAPDDSRAGVDFAGVVESVGKDVTKFSPGDAVFGGRNGAFAEYVVIPEDRAIARIPAGIAFEQAAGVPIAAVTALQALREKGGLKSGQKVLINGASGGVGTYAVQIAKAMGADVTGVCSTRNVEMVQSLGADTVVDYKNDDYTQRDERYDLIVDNVGNRSLSANRGVLKDGGTMVLVGGPKGDWIGPFKPPLKALMVSPFVDETITTLLAELSSEDLEFLADLMVAGKLRTVIDKRYPLSATAEAVRYSETGRARGKIIIDVAPVD